MTEPAYEPPPGWERVPATPSGFRVQVREMSAAERGDFLDRRAGQEDAHIGRCTCGSWVYATAACGTCGRVSAGQQSLEHIQEATA